MPGPQTPSPATGVPAKVCVACRKDVTRLPRHKDEKGRYLCNECMEVAKARAAERSAVPASAPVAEEEAAMAALLPGATGEGGAGAAGTLPCPKCGTGMAPGSVACARCGFDARAGVRSMSRRAKAARGAPGGAEAAKAAGKLARGAARLAAGPTALALCAAAAVVAGVVGAAIWALVTYTTHREIKFVAIGVGLVVGVGARAGAGRYVGFMSALIAGVVALAAAAGGRYFTLSTMVDEAVHKVNVSLDFSDEQLRLRLAAEVVKEFEAAGKPLKWPYEGMTAEDAEVEEDYPPDVRKEATKRWEAMTEDQRFEFETRLITEAQAAVRAVTGDIKEQGFLESYDIKSLIFLGIAVVAAFVTGGGGSFGRGD